MKLHIAKKKKYTMDCRSSGKDVKPAFESSPSEISGIESYNLETMDNLEYDLFENLEMCRLNDPENALISFRGWFTKIFG